MTGEDKIVVGDAGTYSAEVTQPDSAKVLRYELLNDGRPLSWSNVVDRWQNDQWFRRYFISLLIDAPYPAYFWETPPVTRATMDRQFEFVLVDSPQLANVTADQRSFDEHFSAADPDASVIKFSNIGGDATLIVPCPRGAISAYSQLSSFARLAPADQQHQFWALVASTLERCLGAERVWLSTSGLGVYWLHIRLDSTPKYYTHQPYRT